MATISLEQQKQLGRYLRNIQRAGEDPESAEAAEASRIKSAGFVAFVMLGGFAILKDIFDFVFVGMAFSKSKLAAGADVVSSTADAATIALLAFPELGSKIAAIITKAVGWGATAVSWIGSAIQIKTQFEGVVLPFLFTNMFMVAVIATLLLSGMGLKSYKIFLGFRSVFVFLVTNIVEIVPVLNIFPWTTLFIVYLYFEVRRLKKKEQDRIGTTT